MRSFVLLLTVAAAALQAAEVTVVLQFDGEHSDRSVDAMKSEVQSIFRDTGVRFDFRSRENPDAASAALIVLRFKGQCRMDPYPSLSNPALMDERGAFAETYVTDGNILPFGQVHCERVSRSIRAGLRSAERRQADLAYGRALGRVVAHEIYHMLSKSRSHAESGVNKAALSSAQLLSRQMNLSPADFERFYNP